MERLYREQVVTPIGSLTVLATEKGICFIGLPGREQSENEFVGKNFKSAEMLTGGPAREASNQLDEYFRGGRKQFELPLDIRQSEFNKRVLDEVAAIEYGRVKTYGEIAGILGKKGAARAVGRANASNPIPIIIPCHRVVATNGLGGYGGGLEMKRRLLELEGGPQKKPV